MSIKLAAAQHIPLKLTRMGIKELRIMKTEADKKNKLYLVSNGNLTREQSHLDIAIESTLLKSLNKILISLEHNQFHLSIRIQVYGQSDSFWVNECGTKPFVTDQALKAIRHILPTASSVKKSQLHDFESRLIEYRHGPANILVLSTDFP